MQHPKRYHPPSTAAPSTRSVRTAHSQVRELSRAFVMNEEKEKISRVSSRLSSRDLLMIDKSKTLND